MKLAGALRLCQSQDPERRQAVLVAEGYRFLVKQHPSEVCWELQDCVLEVRVAGASLVSELGEDPLVREDFGMLSDCLFHLASVYGLTESGWYPAPLSRRACMSAEDPSLQEKVIPLSSRSTPAARRKKGA